jgi:hypothetical protein
MPVSLRARFVAGRWEENDPEFGPCLIVGCPRWTLWLVPVGIIAASGGAAASLSWFALSGNTLGLSNALALAVVATIALFFFVFLWRSRVVIGEQGFGYIGSPYVGVPIRARWSQVRRVVALYPPMRGSRIQVDLRRPILADERFITLGTSLSYSASTEELVALMNQRLEAWASRHDRA